MPSTRRATVKKTTKVPRSPKPRAKPLAVAQPQRSAPAVQRLVSIADGAPVAAPKAAGHMFDLMLAFSPVNIMLRQQAAFASMLSNVTRNEPTATHLQPVEATKKSSSRRKG